MHQIMASSKLKKAWVTSLSLKSWRDTKPVLSCIARLLLYDSSMITQIFNTAVVAYCYHQASSSQQLVTSMIRTIKDNFVRQALGFSSEEMELQKEDTRLRNGDIPNNLSMLARVNKIISTMLSLNLSPMKKCPSLKRNF